ncbi:hypothetical protein R6Q59_004859 [Mikania micrantha]
MWERKDLTFSLSTGKSFQISIKNCRVWEKIPTLSLSGGHGNDFTFWSLSVKSYDIVSARYLKTIHNAKSSVSYPFFWFWMDFVFFFYLLKTNDFSIMIRVLQEKI